MESTFEFKMPSGVMACTKELKGKHQKILTKEGSDSTTRMNAILSDILVSVGSEKNISEEFVSEMLTADRNWAFFMARQFSMDFPKTFTTKLKYTGIDGKEKSEDVEIDLSSVDFKPYKNQYEEYSEVQKKYEIELPNFEGKVSFFLLDGNGEKRMSYVKRKELNSNTDIECRIPTYLHKNSPIKLNLDNLSLRQIESLRKQISEYEGKVNSDFEIESNESQIIGGSSQKTRINVLGDMGFFFPSGVFS